MILKSISIINWLRSENEDILTEKKRKNQYMRKKKNIITEKEGKKETYRKIIKRNIFTILIIILIRYKRSAEVIIIKTETKTIIIIIVKLFIIMTLSYHTVWPKNKLHHTHTHIWEYGYCFTYFIICLHWGTSIYKELRHFNVTTRGSTYESSGPILIKIC